MSSEMDRAEEGGVVFVVDDEPLVAGPSNEESVGGGRHTPSTGRRSKTNTSRPHSRPKEARDPSPVNPLYVSSSTSRAVLSRRKERRWTNDRRIGAEVKIDRSVRVSNKNDAAYDIGPEDFDVNAASRLIYEQEYRSCFEGFDNDLRRAFLNCDEGFVCAGTKPSRSSSAKSIQNNSPAARFMRVDKNLRKHLLETGSRTPFCFVLEDLETVLLNALDTESPNKDDLMSTVSQRLRAVLVKDPSFSERKNNAPRLELVFKSGLYRLLTHGLCQFHGLVSKSKQRADGTRVLQIHIPKFDPVMADWVLQSESASDEESLVLKGEQTFHLVPFLHQVNAWKNSDY